MLVEVVPASPEQQPVVENLLQLYIHDFSEFPGVGVDIQENGRFDYPGLARFWREPDCLPFLVRVDQRLAGFILAKTTGPPTPADPVIWDVAEFFVLRSYRRQGVGIAAAAALWQGLPGQWQVRVMEQNQSAQQFWEQAIARFTAAAAGYSEQWVQQRGSRWRVFSFAAP